MFDSLILGMGSNSATRQEEQQEMKIKKLTETAVVPVTKEGSIGYDVTANSVVKPYGEVKVVYIGTGIAVEPPEGYATLLIARSSLHKTGYKLANSVGVIDPSYRGEIIVPLTPIPDSKQVPVEELMGTRIAQLILIPAVVTPVEEVEELTETERGTGGFGSTGK